MAKSELEERFLEIVHEEEHRNNIKLACPEREHRFHPTRRWRFDFAWPQVMVAVEIDGAIFANGRHAVGAGIAADADKYNAAIALGWKVLRFTETQLRRPDKVFELLLVAMGAIDSEGVGQ